MSGDSDRPNFMATGAAYERPIVIALINNMPHRAQESCEYRFRNLFQGSHAGRNVSWRLFDGTCQSLAAGRPSAHGGIYEKFDALFEAEIDAVIVTGAEPQASTIREEPTWNVVTKIIDWAERQGVAVLWSCLASHAAVSYLDGIERHRRSAKLSGLFECHIAVPNHPLMGGLDSRWSTPHSRWHSLRRRELEGAGYEILTTCGEDELDTFSRGHGPNFLFCQGHPEYERDTLWLEYRRDLLRFLTGQSRSAPELPRNCLTTHIQSEIMSLIAGGGGPADIREGLRRIEAREEFLKTVDQSASARRLLCSNWLLSSLDRCLAPGFDDPADVGRPHDLVLEVSG